MRRIGFAGVLLMAMAISPAFGADLAGSQDPAGLKRYQGSEIIHYLTTGYSQYKLDRDGGWHKADMIEGDVARAVYLVPAGHTSLEIYRNYQQMLNDAGLHQTFELKSDALSVIPSFFFEQFFFSIEQRDAVHPPAIYGYSDSADTPYYATFNGVKDGKPITVALLIGQSGEMTWNEPKAKPIAVKKGQVVVALDVVTGAAVENKMVLVKAEDMAQSLATTGKIDLYGIYFDVDKSDIKAQSDDTLGEIAKLMKIDTGLRLEVSGHTDNTGKADHNLKLSQDRANSVVHALVVKFGIDPKRLVAKGYGDTKPVAANTSEVGRAKNRRVQLRRL